jgi:dTDP-4-amino-4,6-dideoxygalactose transaminase
MTHLRVFLSPPHLGSSELEFVREAFESNYIAPLGPMVNAFEAEFNEYVGLKHAVALSSGTAAMHLALRFLGVSHGDEVFASTLTFMGSVSPVTFEGSIPVFLDADKESWNMDPALLEEELERSSARGRLPKAVIPTDLYGQCCNLSKIVEICDRYGVPIICDSAEAVGARYQKKDDRRQMTDDSKNKTENTNLESETLNFESGSAGNLEPGTLNLEPQPSGWAHAGKGAKAAIYSFNGNKIITTSGGGMLASDDKELIDYARFLSQQARDPFPHYEHTEIGYNYRMSNILAAIGRGQLQVLDERVKRRREIFQYYKNALGELPGVEFMPEPEWSYSNRWLTVVLITPQEFGADREQIRLALEEENIESRPVWKPMHLQPVFDCQPKRQEVGRLGSCDAKTGKKPKKRYRARAVGGSVAEDLFNRGLCLPSGTALTDEDLDRVINVICRIQR